MKLSDFMACAGLAIATLPLLAQAETPRFFELEGFGRFLDSNPKSTAITEEGAIALPPGVKQRFADAASAFGAACAQGDRVVLSRVEDGQILSVDAKGQVREIHKVNEAMITALLCDADAIYAAVAGPAAKIYRIDTKGRIDTFFKPEATYIWDMVQGPEGSIFVATGEPAKVLQVDPKGGMKTLFTAEQGHLKALAYHPTLGLFVGGGERGVVYRASGPTHTNFRALYDTGTAEITALLIGEPYVFVAGVTGSAALVASDASDAPPSGTTPPKKGKSGEVRSQLVRISMDGTSDILAGSSDEAVFALARDARGQVIVATGATGQDDPRGRLYSIDPENKLISMLYQSPSRRLTHLVSLPNHALAAIANGGARIVELTEKLAATGEFFTQAFDTGINSAFGLVQVLGHLPKGTGANVALRTGQTAEPDATWSPWTANIEAPGNTSFKVASGRFVQARLTLRGDGAATPWIHRLRVAYLRQNVAPFVREVTVLRKGLALFSVSREDAKAKLVAVADKTDDQATPENTAPHMPARARQVQDPGSLTVKWQSDDPNGDELNYTLFLRGADERAWRLFKADLSEPFFTFKSAQLPDGHYYFRVRASDARSNPDGMDKSDTKDSRAVLIDNTPPSFDALKVAIKQNNVRVTGAVQDTFGPLIELNYALDGKIPRPIASEDGLLDGPKEKFVIDLRNLEPGHHTLTVRAVDEADNEAVAQAHVDISAH